MGYCKICERRWKGLSECHCSGCCEHFRSVSAFEKHRVGKEDKRRCLSGNEMLNKGMVYLVAKKYWIGESMPVGREY